jgi:uncharacterized membrane protein YoaK (UPF0700 family)
MVRRHLSEKRNGTAGPSPGPARGGMLVVLAVAAGCVDAISYLGLGGVLTAAMTGNTILLGIAVGQGEFPTAARACTALAGFMLGAILASAATAHSARHAWSRAVTAAFALELVVLVVLALGWLAVGDRATQNSAYLFSLVAAAGIALGIQSATVHRLGVEGVSTTYVTGTLTNSAMRLVAWLHALRDKAAASPIAPERPAQSRKISGPGYPLLVWLAYGAGAAAAGVMDHWWPALSPIVAGRFGTLPWPPAALLLPITIVFAVTASAALSHRRAADH